MTASVKVMRSFDYCHFEVCISDDNATTDEHIDALRKRCARLADKAVSQYKIAKAAAEKLAAREHERDRIRREVERIEKMAEGDRSPNQQALVKAMADRDWDAYCQNRYDYQDDYEDEWEDDYDDD